MVARVFSFSPRSLSFISSLLIGLLGVSAGAAPSSTQSSELSEVARRLVVRMYSIHGRQFDYSYFNGKFDPSRGCKLLRSFFIDALLKPESKNGCDTVEELRFAPVTMSSDSRMPEPEVDYDPYWKIGDAIDQDGVVEISAYTSWAPFDKNSDLKKHSGGRTVFFIKNIDGNPKIFNVVKFPEWPVELAEGRCLLGRPYPVLRPSSPREWAVIPEECRGREGRGEGKDGGPSGSKPKPKS